MAKVKGEIKIKFPTKKLKKILKKLKKETKWIKKLKVPYGKLDFIPVAELFWGEITPYDMEMINNQPPIQPRPREGK